VGLVRLQGFLRDRGTTLRKHLSLDQNMQVQVVHLKVKRRHHQRPTSGSRRKEIKGCNNSKSTGRPLGPNVLNVGAGASKAMGASVHPKEKQKHIR